MSGDVTRYYERLEPRERMIAAIAAAARADDQEIDRLVGSCPRHTYVETDVAFTQRMRAAGYVTTALSVELGPLLRTLIVLDSVCDYLEVRSDRYIEALWLAARAALWQGVQWGWARSGRNDKDPLSLFGFFRFAETLRAWVGPRGRNRCVSAPGAQFAR
jgi:hypothetical protein